MANISNFGRAFKEARAAGKNTFEWNGDTFTTELKEERTARLASEKSSKQAKDLQMRSAAQEAADDARIAEALKKDEAKQAPAALPPLKKPASKTEPKTPEPKVWSSPRAKPETTTTRIEPVMGKEPDKPYKSSSTRIEPTMGRGGGGGMGGTLSPGTSPKSLRREPTFSSGGAVKSASKRADGCAQRGFTKGRMV